MFHMEIHGISSVIPRPCDKDDCEEWSRRGINDMIRRYCRSAGLHYTESWRALTNDNETFKKELYARDDLHLRDPGVEALRLHFQGFFASMQESKYNNE